MGRPERHHDPDRPLGCRTGGSWAFSNVRGDESYSFHGCFHEISPTRLVQTFTFDGWPDGVSLETLTFTDLGDGRTRLTAQSLVDSFAGRNRWLASGMDVGVNDGYAKLDDFEVSSLNRMGPDEPAMLASWRMNGTEFRAICQPADFQFNDSISLSVTCEDQAEADRLWYGLIAGGGEESMCGWLKDPYGLSRWHPDADARAVERSQPGTRRGRSKDHALPAPHRRLRAGGRRGSGQLNTRRRRR